MDVSQMQSKDILHLTQLLQRHNPYCHGGQEQVTAALDELVDSKDSDGTPISEIMDSFVSSFGITLVSRLKPSGDRYQDCCFSTGLLMDRKYCEGVDYDSPTFETYFPSDFREAAAEILEDDFAKAFLQDIDVLLDKSKSLKPGQNHLFPASWGFVWLVVPDPANGISKDFELAFKLECCRDVSAY